MTDAKPPQPLASRLPRVVDWDSNQRRVVILDQTRLPNEVVFLHCDSVADVWQAIKRLSVRGAPAIGVAAAYGVCLAAREEPSVGRCCEAIDRLATSRPTAVNLFWALQRMRDAVDRATAAGEPLLASLIEEARSIHHQDRELCAAIGRYGADRLLDLPPAADTAGLTLLTHCNAGALATAGNGTALSPIYELAGRGVAVRVFADETRPLLQGSRLTAWELQQMNIPVTVLTDSMAGSLIRSGKIDAVIVGADRISAAGDAANKIGTYPLAVLARYHQIPFFVAAPHSTFDLSLANGDDIPIEHRDSDELSQGFTESTVPGGCSVYNPAFDVTPAELITAIITDLGVIDNPDAEKVLNSIGTR